MELVYKLRDEMFAKKNGLSISEKDACLILAALISYKIVNSTVVNGIRPNSNDILEELHLLNCSNELFSAVPFNDSEIIEIIDNCCK